ncbi:hypothetical protein BJX64DRAFT_125533 [Aspergillus heterothallicus]
MAQITSLPRRLQCLELWKGTDSELLKALSLLWLLRWLRVSITKCTATTFCLLQQCFEVYARRLWSELALKRYQFHGRDIKCPFTAPAAALLFCQTNSVIYHVIYGLRRGSFTMLLEGGGIV